MIECEKDYYIEATLAFLLIASELIGKSKCEHNSISEFIMSIIPILKKANGNYNDEN